MPYPKQNCCLKIRNFIENSFNISRLRSEYGDKNYLMYFYATVACQPGSILATTPHLGYQEYLVLGRKTSAILAHKIGTEFGKCTK